jgi:transcriptional regulator with XRE-family HTH domain
MDQAAIVRRLRKLCAESSQKNVADELGISPQYLCDILKGRRQPGASVLQALGLTRKVSYSK